MPLKFPVLRLEKLSPLIANTLVVSLFSIIGLVISLRTLSLDYWHFAVYSLAFFVVGLIYLKPGTAFSLSAILAALCTTILLMPKLVYFGTLGFYTSNQLSSILEAGVFDQDEAFHLAIVAAIQAYGYPSTAIHGAPYLPYHTGSHYFLALISAVSGIEPIKLAPYLNTYFTTLFLTFLFVSRAELKNSGWGAPIALSLLFIQNMIQPFFWAFDISTPIALLFGLILLSRVLLGRPAFSDAALLFLTLISKVSIGLTIAMVYLVCVTTFDRGKLADTGKAIFNAVLAIGIVAILVSGAQAQNLHFEYGSLHDQLLSQEKRESTFLLFIALPLLLVLTAVILKEGRLIFVGLSMVLLVFIAVNTSFESRAHMHFVNAANWISAYLLAGLTFGNSRTRVMHSIAIVLILGACLIAIYGLKDKSKTVIDTLGQTVKGTTAKPYLDKLVELRNRRGRFLIYIPESEVGFWGHWAFSYAYSSRYFMPFWIPMLSGKAAFKGYNGNTMKGQRVGGYSPGTYGYITYERGYRDVCRDGAYVLRLTLSQGIIREEELRCSGGAVE